MAIAYTDHAATQLPVNAADTWTRTDGKKVTGDLIYREAIYTVPAAGAVVTGDLLRLCKLPANFILIPQLSHIISEAMGTAFNIAKIGDIAVDGTTADNNDARYSATTFSFATAGLMSWVTIGPPATLVGYSTPREMWLTATLGTITTLTVGKKIRFIIVGAVTS